MNNNYDMYSNQSTAPPYENFDSYYNNQVNNNINNGMQYAENILELNIGKYASFYMSYSDSLEWRDRIFSGIITAAGRDYAVIKDQNTNSTFLLWTVYLDYVEFKDDIILRG